MALSKTETAILANAARRASGTLLPLPRFIYVRGLAVVIALERLIRRGLIHERQALADEPIWRAGRTATTLSVSEAGFAALNAAGGAAHMDETTSDAREAQDQAAMHAGELLSEEDLHWVLMAIMGKPHGADITSIQRETGLSSQSVRAAISGLRAEGYVFDHVREASGLTTYQLIGWLPGEGGLEHVTSDSLHA
ncbi:hypothetical protein [Iodidimonas sp. SYSU 1G8]|uniref:hypothetical protein n=1 Tax=Iodidimonas sp. SYSU 1G8 TaxID=3133967 RepID=UPI0031FE8F9A